MVIIGDRNQFLKISIILELLAGAGGVQASWGVRELAEQVSLPVTTVHRALGALADIGYVRKESSGRYSIGVELMRIARLISDSDSLAKIARPHLWQLVQETGEAAVLARLDEPTKSLIFIDLVPGPRELEYEISLYKPLSIHKGASGMSMLSHLPDGFEAKFNRDFLRYIRSRGVVRSRGHRIPGAVGIASVVMAPTGRVIGSVTLTIPESRLPSEARCQQLEERVLLCAKKIQRTLRGSANVAL